MHARVAHERGAGLPVAGQQRERVGRHTAPSGAPRRAPPALAGDCSAGFSTAALPAASAAAVMPHGIASGKFQGAITAATPRGR